MRKAKHYCCECVSWQPGTWWRSSAQGIVADGSCKGTGRSVLNCHKACTHFAQKKRTGFMVHGEGPITPQEIEYIAQKIGEIIEDNMPANEDIKQETI